MKLSEINWMWLELAWKFLGNIRDWMWKQGGRGRGRRRERERGGGKGVSREWDKREVGSVLVSLIGRGREEESEGRGEKKGERSADGGKRIRPEHSTNSRNVCCQVRRRWEVAHTPSHV